jgi:hypothetical protein
MQDILATESTINEFRKKYFEQVEFDYWQERLFTAYRRYSRLKKPENKAIYIVEVYSIYIQVIEILLINMHALTVEPANFLPALAIKSDKIVEFAQDILSNRKFLESFTHNFLYKIRGVEDIDREAKGEIDFDINLLEECLKDYIQDYNFLNSYKHGFRLHSTHGVNSVAIGTSPDNMVQILQGDSQLTYYEFKRSKVSEITLTFNNMRVVGKALFVIYYLQNIRLSALATYDKPKKVRYPTFYINDQEAWNKDFGQSRFITELFHIVSNKPREK